MHTDMIIRKKTTRIWTIIGICSMGLYFTACDNAELPGKEKVPANVELRFAASIFDTPSTKTTNGPDIITGAAFPNGTHTFGMFLTYEAGDPVTTGSEDNMKSILTRGTGPDVWTYTDKNDHSLSLTAKHGEKINITGYYPWMENATANSVPFDLTGDAATWKDLLYLSSPADAQQVLDATPIALTFSHAYCWVTVKLSKLTDKNEVPVKAVSIENSYNSLKGIMNKGTINPKTGDVINGTTGPITINCSPLVNIPLEGIIGGPTPSEFHFLVPSFMSPDIKDSDIVIRVTTETSGVTEVLSFPLTKAHLNSATNQYGFQKGMHNTYNIVYNNSEMILSLSGWQETSIEASTLGEGVAETPVSVEILPSWGMNVPKLEPTDHKYHSFLGEVAENNNGEYITLEISGDPALHTGWRPFLTKEPIYPKLMVARNLAGGGAPIPWKDETGVLTAKQACVDLRDGGYKDWRLPRVGELFFFAYQTPDAIKAKSDQLWSATEFDADNCYSTKRYLGSTFPAKASKKENLYVRCVRDYNKPDSTI